MRFLRRRSPSGQSPLEAARKPSACTHQPEQSTTAQEKCDSSEGWKPEAESKVKLCEREDSRRRASQRLACRLKWALPIWAYSRFFYSCFHTQPYPSRSGEQTESLRPRLVLFPESIHSSLFPHAILSAPAITPFYDPCMALQNASAPPSFLRPLLATHAPKSRLLFRMEMVFVDQPIKIGVTRCALNSIREGYDISVDT